MAGIPASGFDFRFYGALAVLAPGRDHMTRVVPPIPAETYVGLFVYPVVFVGAIE